MVVGEDQAPNNRAALGQLVNTLQASIDQNRNLAQKWKERKREAVPSKSDVLADMRARLNALSSPPQSPRKPPPHPTKRAEERRPHPRADLTAEKTTEKTPEDPEDSDELKSEELLRWAQEILINAEKKEEKPAPQIPRVKKADARIRLEESRTSWTPSPTVTDTFTEKKHLDDWRERVASRAKEMRADFEENFDRWRSRPTPRAYTASQGRKNRAFPRPSPDMGWQPGEPHFRTVHDYEVAWKCFEEKCQRGLPVFYADVPWPFSLSSAALIEGSDDVTVIKHKLHDAMRRWHPDKWSRVSAFASDADRITQRVKQAAQRILAERDHFV